MYGIYDMMNRKWYFWGVFRDMRVLRYGMTSELLLQVHVSCTYYCTPTPRFVTATDKAELEEARASAYANNSGYMYIYVFFCMALLVQVSRIPIPRTYNVI